MGILILKLSQNNYSVRCINKVYGQKIYVEKEKCISCSSCRDNLPNYFRFDKHLSSETHNKGLNVQTARVTKQDETNIQKIIDCCPVSCIHWKK